MKRRIAAAGLGMLAAVASATDFKERYHAPEPVAARAVPRAVVAKDTPAEEAADFACWKAEVYGPLTFTNRTCKRLRREFEARTAERGAARDERLELQRSLISVRQGMLDRAGAFGAPTARVRALNRQLCEVLRLHVEWMDRVLDAELSHATADPPPPSELIAAKQLFTELLADCREACEAGADESLEPQE